MSRIKSRRSLRAHELVPTSKAIRTMTWQGEQIVRRCTRYTMRRGLASRSSQMLKFCIKCLIKAFSISTTDFQAYRAIRVGERAFSEQSQVYSMHLVFLPSPNLFMKEKVKHRFLRRSRLLLQDIFLPVLTRSEHLRFLTQQFDRFPLFFP